MQKNHHFSQQMLNIEVQQIDLVTVMIDMKMQEEKDYIIKI